MNEPSVFETPNLTMPLDTVHHIASDDFAPRTARHAEIHNVYGMENTRATYDGLRALRPDERAFVMTRASYAGGQRYAVTWTGDNSSTWDHLKLSVHQLINLGLSGFAWAAADVGGYTGGPSPELMTRWFEIAAFTPIFRDHSSKDAPRAEPWVDGPEQLAIRRRYVEERYRLLPYLYALADENARTGDPIMRPVFYDYPRGAERALRPGHGLHPRQGPADRAAAQAGIAASLRRLPADRRLVRSVDRTAGRPARTGPRPFDHVRETPRLDRLPVYVRAGTILPSQPLTCRARPRCRQARSTLDVYPGADCARHALSRRRPQHGLPARRLSSPGNHLPAGGRAARDRFRTRRGFLRAVVAARSRSGSTAGKSPPGSRADSERLKSRVDPASKLLQFELPADRAGRRVTIG